jgi:hypothetical protein
MIEIGAHRQGIFSTSLHIGKGVGDISDLGRQIAALSEGNREGIVPIFRERSANIPLPFEKSCRTETDPIVVIRKRSRESQ